MAFLEIERRVQVFHFKFHKANVSQPYLSKLRPFFIGFRMVHKTSLIKLEIKKTWVSKTQFPVERRNFKLH